jgi:lysophospholipase L1-like esterase
VRPSIRRAVPRVAALLFPLGVLLLLEVVLRVGAYAYHGFSEYYLYYGFQSYVGRVALTPEWVHRGRHFKFPPNYTLRNAAGQAEETATINALGFRGPDFEPRKPVGTFRVVCLGESSTFGFHNADAETYPYLLHQLFESQPRAMKVEVINAGFPYYNSDSILSLVQSEILSYDPDLLTIYGAYNDAAWPLQQADAITQVAAWFRDHSFAYLRLQETVGSQFNKWQGRIARLVFGDRASVEAFAAQTTQVAARYRRNLEAVIALAKSRGIPVILIKQPMTARIVEIQSGEYRKSYEEEFRQFSAKFKANEDLSLIELLLLGQHRVVEEMEAIAKEHNLAVVDNAAIVDADRKLMASYVHLTAEANRRLARALQPVIETYLPKTTSR